MFDKTPETSSPEVDQSQFNTPEPSATETLHEMPKITSNARSKFFGLFHRKSADVKPVEVKPVEVEPIKSVPMKLDILEKSTGAVGTKYEMSFDVKKYRELVGTSGEKFATVTVEIKKKGTKTVHTSLGQSLEDAMRWQKACSDPRLQGANIDLLMDQAFKAMHGKTGEVVNKGVDAPRSTVEPREIPFQELKQVVGW